MARFTLEVREELKRRLYEPLIPSEEAVVAAQMSAVLVRSDHDVFVFHDGLVWYALGTDDRVILYMVDKHGYFDIFHEVMCRVIFLVRLKALFIICFPIDLLFQFTDVVEFCQEVLKINSKFLHVRRGQVFLVELELCLVPLAKVPVDRAVPAIF